MNHAPHILIVDDDADIRELLKDFFQRRGLKVSLARDGIGMHTILNDANNVDIIVLDLMLPGQSGLELCQDIRKHSKVPIIMLTAISETTDRIVGLEMGADDYISKPFDPRELLARIKAVLRRHASSKDEAAGRPPVDGTYGFAGWVLDVDRRRLLDPKGVRVELTRAEFNLLQALVESAERVLSREQLIERCGGDASYSFDRSIDILVSRLRRKLEDDPKAPRLIQTVRGGGYQFVAKTSVG
ncbi:MAG TPA: response regulator transcription factor [Rhizobium sp.]